MTKAEELSQNRYPTLAEKYAFIDGYHQAEKDNELTWEDLATLEKLGVDFIKQNHTPMSEEEFYKKVLKQYKDYKERKEKCQ
jgi:hypothetical protein